LLAFGLAQVMADRGTVMGLCVGVYSFGKAAR